MQASAGGQPQPQTPANCHSGALQSWPDDLPLTHHGSVRGAAAASVPFALPTALPSSASSAAFAFASMSLSAASFFDASVLCEQYGIN